MIQNVIDNGLSRSLTGGRTAYYNAGVVVIHNPGAADGGTAFVASAHYFWSLPGR
jgi:hypothetical protein